MRKLTILLLSLIMLTGCPNINELPERVNIKINFVGLEFQSNETDSLKSTLLDIFSDFEHTYAHADFYMDKEGASLNVSTGSIAQGISTFLAVGTYHVSGWGGYAYPYGNADMSFQISDQEVVVGTSSTSINLDADPDCCLILVADFEDLLESAYISGGENPGNAFFRYDHYYYTYISPAPGNQAHIVKKSGAELIINTGEFSIGNTYQVEITSD